ncbi:MAG: hypothetical protein DWH91_05995 [Planctomycetota bacterium]|nr:MAG: hypothetical protein DWH91_05995 [Planctomycetota bacterium]
MHIPIPLLPFRVDPPMRTAATLCGILTMTAPLLAAPPVDYLQQIRPIFRDHCYECHGPKKQESGLRLDKRQEALAGGNTGPAIVPGDTTSGLLLKFIQTEDPEQVMPPKGDRLTAKQIELIQQWIKNDAPWPEYEAD